MRSAARPSSRAAWLRRIATVIRPIRSAIGSRPAKMPAVERPRLARLRRARARAGAWPPRARAGPVDRDDPAPATRAAAGRAVIGSGSHAASDYQYRSTATPVALSTARQRRRIAQPAEEARQARSALALRSSCALAFSNCITLVDPAVEEGARLGLALALVVDEHRQRRGVDAAAGSRAWCSGCSRSRCRRRARHIRSALRQPSFARARRGSAASPGSPARGAAPRGCGAMRVEPRLDQRADALADLHRRERSGGRRAAIARVDAGDPGVDHVHRPAGKGEPRDVAIDAERAAAASSAASLQPSNAALAAIGGASATRSSSSVGSAGRHHGRHWRSASAARQAGDRAPRPAPARRATSTAPTRSASPAARHRRPSRSPRRPTGWISSAMPIDQRREMRRAHRSSAPGRSAG